MRLQGKTALITGAARGIGLEFARAHIAEWTDINTGAVETALANLMA